MQFYTSFDNMSMEVAPYPPGAKIDKSPFVERNRLLSGHRHQLQAEILQNMLNLTVRDPLNSANNVTRNARKYIQLRVRCDIQLEHLLILCLLGFFSILV